MPGKNRIVRQINLPTPVTAGAVVTASAPNYAAPARPQPPAPENLSLSTTIERRAVTSTAQIYATWVKPIGVQPERYTIEWSTDVGFADDATNGQNAATPSATIPGLKLATVYYVRVAAWVHNVRGTWSDVVSIMSANDIVPPDPPGVPTWTWADDGNLIVRSSEPTNANYHWIEINIWSDAAKTTHYTTAFFVGGVYTWLLAENQYASGSSGDAAVYIELRSQSWAGYFSDPVVPAVQPNKPAPLAPTSLTSSWTGDTGTAGADCIITCVAPAGAVRYTWTIDGEEIPTPFPTLTYVLDANRADHGGTADPTLSISVVAHDALGQPSPAASITATNAVPLAPTSVTIAAAGTSNLVIDIAGAVPADFRDYTVRILRDSSLVETLTTSEPFFMRSMAVPGTYQVGVKVNDVFGQPSATETMSSAVLLDFITLQKLRAETEYSDSAGTAAATLDGLKDGNTASTVVSYSTSSWSSILAQRPFLDRSRTITALAGITGGSLQMYVGLSKDNITYTWYAGPLTGTYSNTMTAVASEAAAQAAAFTPPASGRLELPAIAEARFVKLGVKGSSGGFLVQMREFYPRRLVQTDDIEVEAIQAINIAADAITANKIAAGAITAVHISATAIDGKTITGSTIQTSASGARVVLSSDTNGGLVGYGASDTYNVATGSGTYQVLWKKTNGKLFAGGGAVMFDSDGQTITGDSFTFSLYNLTPVAPVRANAIEWTVGSGQRPSITGSSSNGQLLMRGQRITLAIPVSSSDSYGINLQLNGAHFVTAASLAIAADQNTAATAFKVTAGLFASGCTIETDGGLNLGSATGAGTGQVRGSGYLMTSGAGSLPASAVAALGYDSGSTRGLLVAINNGTYLRLDLEGLAVNIRSGTTTRFQANGTGIGFFGGTPVAKPTITGSRGGNAALANLLTALASLGLLTDSTT